MRYVIVLITLLCPITASANNVADSTELKRASDAPIGTSQPLTIDNLRPLTAEEQVILKKLEAIEADPALQNQVNFSEEERKTYIKALGGS